MGGNVLTGYCQTFENEQMQQRNMQKLMYIISPTEDADLHFRIFYNLYDCKNRLPLYELYPDDCLHAVIPSLSTLHYLSVKISNEHAYHLFHTASNA